jgi:hypothetical protein
MIQGFKPGRRQSDGSVELLIVLPVFLILTWGIALIGLTLLQKSRLQQAAWVFSMAASHQAPMSDAMDQAREVLVGSTRRDDLQFNSATDLTGLAPSVLSLNQSLPQSFRIALAAATPHKQTISIRHDVPPVFAWFIGASEIGSRTNPIPGVEEAMEEETTVTMPGSNFSASSRGGFLLKHALWQEAMRAAGFPAWLPLEALGAEEVAAAFGY